MPSRIRLALARRMARLATFTRSISRTLTAATIALQPIAGADDDPPPVNPPAPPAGNPPTPELKYSEDDLNRIVQERLGRDRRDRLSDEEIQQLRDRAARADELEREQQTDSERVQADLEDANKRATTAEAERDEARAEVRKVQIRSAIVAAAAKAGTDPEIAYAVLADRGFKIADPENGDKNFEVTIADDGQVTGAADAVKAFAAEKNVGSPTPPTGSGDGGARPPVTPPDLQTQIQEAEKAGDYTKAQALKAQQLAEQ